MAAYSFSAVLRRIPYRTTYRLGAVLDLICIFAGPSLRHPLLKTGFLAAQLAKSHYFIILPGSQPHQRRTDLNQLGPQGFTQLPTLR